MQITGHLLLASPLRLYARSRWEAYKRANEIFAETIAAVATEEDFIWVHDYHLMLVPQLVRRKIQDAIIGWFLHTPYPSGAGRQ